MRKMFVIFGLVAGVAIFANDAFAQRGGGGWGGGGGRGGISFGIGTGGFGGGYGGGYGNRGGFYPGGGFGGYGGNFGGYGGNFNRGYYPNTQPFGNWAGNYRYSSPNYYSQPNYGTPYYSSPNYYYQDSAAVPAESRQSFYPDSKPANVTVIVPYQDAEIWFNSQPTTQRGTQRHFQTAPLEGGNYTYTVRARWMDNGQPVEQQRQVQVQAGQDTTVDFRNPG